MSEHYEPQSQVQGQVQGQEEEGLDSVLDRLEKQITRLADGSAPLDELVEAHEEARKLIDTAQGRLRELMARQRPDEGRPEQDEKGGGDSSPREPSA